MVSESTTSGRPEVVIYRIHLSHDGRKSKLLFKAFFTCLIFGRMTNI